MCDCFEKLYNGVTYEERIIDCEEMRAAKEVSTPTEFKFLIALSPVLALTAIAFLVCFVQSRVFHAKRIAYVYIVELCLAAFLIAEGTIRYQLNTDT